MTTSPVIPFPRVTAFVNVPFSYVNTIVRPSSFQEVCLSDLLKIPEAATLPSSYQETALVMDDFLLEVHLIPHIQHVQSGFLQALFQSFFSSAASSS